VRYFYLIFVPYLLFATSDIFCLVCHGNSKMNFSKLVPKKEWKSLTSDGGKKLQEIHKNNLDVQAYFKGEAYNEKALFRDIKYSSESEKMHDARKFATECFVCHRDKRHLAYLYARSEWEHLNPPLNKLIVKHQYQVKVVKQLQSKAFTNVLPEFIKYISVYAPRDTEDVRKASYMIPTVKKVPAENNNEKSYLVYKFETKSFNFTYKIEQGTKQNAKDVYKYVTHNLKKQSFKKPISIVLTESAWETDPGYAFMFVMTLGLAPVEYTKNMNLSITSDEMLYESKKILIKTAGGIMENTQGMGMIKVIETLFDTLNKSTNSNNK